MMQKLRVRSMDIRKGGEYPRPKRLSQHCKLEDRQFRFTWRLWVIVATCLAALALPIASIILTLQVLTKRDGEPPPSDGSVVLEDVLRGIADEKLSP
jgi:hypothetical protein